MHLLIIYTLKLTLHNFWGMVFPYLIVNIWSFVEQAMFKKIYLRFLMIEQESAVLSLHELENNYFETRVRFGKCK